MKLKDIEKNLKREQNEHDVPDVYPRASKAPLNRLLSGETPLKAFQKHLVMRLLFIVLIIFLVAAIAMSAIWLSDGDTQIEPDCYVSVKVQNGEEEIKLGLILSGSKNIVTVVVESRNGVEDHTPIVSHSSSISDFIAPKQNDKVRIEILCASSATINEVARYIGGELEILYGGVAFEKYVASNSSSTRSDIANYINAISGAQPQNMSTDALIEAYWTMFA